MNTANQITPILLASDDVYAKVIYRGTQILSIKFSGITSMTEIYRAIAEATYQVRGMATLSLRNLSQGWNISRSLMLSAS